MHVYKGDPTKLAGRSPVLSMELLQFVERCYDLQTDHPVKLGGSWNLNVLADGHVVRVYGPWVTAERLQELQRIRQILRSRGIPVAELKPARDGSSICTFDDCVVEVERYVGGIPMKTWNQVLIGMGALGQVHTLMADLDIDAPPPVANHLPEELALAGTEDVLRVMRAWQSTASEERYINAVEALAHLLPVMNLPVQLVHGDFKDNNVIFRDEELVAVLDFDFMGVRPRIDDLALPLHTMLQRGEKMGKVRKLVEAYNSGCSVPLSAQERRALPYAMARMSLAYLQYLMIPGDEAYMSRCRQEFNESRGPACEWWLRKLEDDDFREGGFV
jgi:Ser/Thr protein kinase RdoA (MazF antagonist)